MASRWLLSPKACAVWLFDVSCWWPKPWSKEKRPMKFQTNIHHIIKGDEGPILHHVGFIEPIESSLNTFKMLAFLNNIHSYSYTHIYIYMYIYTYTYIFMRNIPTGLLAAGSACVRWRHRPIKAWLEDHGLDDDAVRRCPSDVQHYGGRNVWDAYFLGWTCNACADLHSRGWLR